jgi:hypothetical protein
MEPLSTPSREDAALWMRDVGILRGLEAAELMSTARPARRLRSLLEVAEFLVPFEDLDGSITDAGVNFVDPERLSEWTRETIGDHELADRIDEIIATRKPYASLVPPLKELVLARVSQYWELLRPDQAG